MPKQRNGPLVRPPRKAKPRKYRPPSVKDLIREIYNNNGLRSIYHFERAHGTDAERLLRAQGLSEKLASTMTEKEQLNYIASFSGLKPGRTALTLPERLTIVWLLKNNFSFGGVWPQITNPSADFLSQYPLEGGRFKAGGAVVDIFISAHASKTKMGVALAIDGSYFHQQSAVSSRDEAQNMLLRSKGYVVDRLKDTEIYQQGLLDQRMRYIVGI